MRIATTLTFFDPSRVVAEQPNSWPMLPSRVPSRLKEIQGTFNHGLLLAEILDIDGSEVLTILNELFLVSQDFPGGENVPELLNEDDLPILLSTFSQVTEILEAAVDEMGRPKGSGGAALEDSGYFTIEQGGSLVFKSRSIPLTELKTQLEALNSMIGYAIDHRLWLWQRNS